jgi:D-alanyl-D-alanine carboxypeptidase/D-alanyl-D-alanine-endopeptidase (penicillin-binding protein 4)
MQQLASSAICWTTMAAACGLAFAQTPRQAVPVAGTPPSATQSVAAQPLAAQSLGNQIAAMVAEPTVARAHWGVMVTALDGTPIYGLNEGQLFQPDSNTKLFTTAAAMVLLGPDRRFETKVFAEGSIGSNGELHGDLDLRGGGDANFASALFPYRPPSKQPANDSQAPPSPLAAIDDLADQVVAKGVKTIDGDVVGDDYDFDPYPLGWAADDLLWGYGAPVSALTIHDNQIDVTITPVSPTKSSTSADIQMSPDLPYYAGERRVETSDDFGPTSVLFERSPGSKDLSITGIVTTKAEPMHEEIAIKDPAEYAALALKTALEKRGVLVRGGANADHYDPHNSAPFLPATQAPIPGYAPEFPRSSPLGRRVSDLGNFMDSKTVECSFTAVVIGPQKVRTELATHESPQVREDVMLTNKVSQNLHAEMMIRNIASTKDCMGEASKGVQWVRHFLYYAGIDKDDFVFYDGSGMSTYDLVTPRATAKLLSFAAHDPKTAAPQPWFADWKASLPIGGVDGTLADRFTKPPLKGRVFAKTGTHSEGNALSGYLDCASGHTVIFSIFVDHHLPGDTAPRATIDRIVAAIAAAE